MTLEDKEKYICTAFQIGVEQLHKMASFNETNEDKEKYYGFVVKLSAIAVVNSIPLLTVSKLYVAFRNADYDGIANNIYNMLIRAKYSDKKEI